MRIVLYTAFLLTLGEKKLMNIKLIVCTIDIHTFQI